MPMTSFVIMKKLTLILTLVISGVAFGQTSGIKSKNSLGLLFSPGYKSASEQLYTFSARGMHAFNRALSAGLEVNYTVQNLSYRMSSDILGGIGFARITPCSKIGLFAEVGFQYYDDVSSSKTFELPAYSPFVALGYQARITNRIGLQFQYRPLTWKGYATEHAYQNNALAKCYIGFSYSY